MGLQFKKVYPTDYEHIKPLLQQYISAEEQKDKFPLLFLHHWKCSIDFCGVMVEDEGKAIAYLGVIFSDRRINEKSEVFGNLTTLIINEKYRGQKLTHRIIQYLQSQGNFSLTAITPIPSLYGMYKSNSFTDLNDCRTVFWKNPFAAKPAMARLITDGAEVEKYLTDGSLQIYMDHKRFNCRMWVFQKNNEAAFVVMKDMKAQRRKFVTQKSINYLDWGFRKFFKTDLLSPIMSCSEIHYCDNYPLLMNHFNDFAALAFKQPWVKAVSVRQEVAMKYKPVYWWKNQFYHSRQMFFSKSVPIENYDTLYSEIFVLDM